jgi:hypothetical protein
MEEGVKKSKSRRKILLKKIWALFSEWVRRKEKGICYTCGIKKNYKEMDAGHYLHNRLDFNPMNVHCQCVRCNKWLSGNLGVYAENLIKEYGIEAVEILRLRSHQIWKPSFDELEKLLEHWKEELKKLEDGNEQRI